MIRKKILLLLMMPPVAFGAPLSNQLNVDVSAKSRWSDNATKENKKDNIFTERQDEYTLAVDGFYQNEWISAKSQYDVSQLTFSENSQPDDSVATGQSELVLGSNTQPLSLTVQHSNEILLNAPDAVDLTSNRDERSSLSVKPSLRFGFGDANQFITSVSRTEIDYKKQLDRSLRTDQVEAVYAHKFNPVDELQLIATSGKTEFDIYPVANYKLDSALLKYSVTLRKLQYSVGVGGNKIKQDQADSQFTSPQYLFNISYTDAFNVFSLDFIQSLTDSSSSGLYRKNNSAESEDDSFISRQNYGIDVVKSTVSTIGWKSTYLCDKCTANLSFTQSTEDMLQLNGDSTKRRVTAGFSYKLTRSSSLDIMGSKSETDFNYLNRFGLGRETYLKLSYRTKLMNRLSLDVFFARMSAETDRRESDYVEGTTGLRLNLEF